MDYGRLKDLMKSKRLSQNYLADQIGIGSGTFSQMMRKENMKVDVFESLATEIGPEIFDCLEITNNGNHGKSMHVVKAGYPEGKASEMMIKVKEENERLRRENNKLKDQIISLQSKLIDGK